MNIDEFFLKQESASIVQMKDSRVVEVFLDSLKEYISGNLQHEKTSFHSIFVNYYQETMDYKTVMGKSDSVYSQWCTALVVFYLQNQVSRYKSIVDQEKMQSWLGELNKEFESHATDLYVQYIKEQWGTFDKKDYMDKLKDSAWRQTIAAKQASGQWTSAEWEMYNHWLKLSACGGTEQDIQNMYDFLTQEDPKLVLSSKMTASVWKSYSAWHSDGCLENYFSVSNAEGTYSYSGGVYIGGYAYDTTDSSEYAWEYIVGSSLFHDSSGSCFSGDTCVLMADGRYKPICDIVQGDSLVSLNGIRKVELVSVPYRKGRSLFRINGWNPRMTCEHPVIMEYPLDEGKQIELAFIDPDRALSLIPQFKEAKVSKLEKGVRICRYCDGKTEPVEVISVEDDTSSEDEFVYDLILEQDGSEFDSFIVGNEKGTFAVLSEIPFLVRYPEAVNVLSFVLQQYGKDICNKYKTMPFNKMRNSGVFRIIRKAIQNGIYEKVVVQKDFGAEVFSYAGIMQQDGKFNQDMGVLYDLLVAELSESVCSVFKSNCEKQEITGQKILQLGTMIGDTLLQNR